MSSCILLSAASSLNPQAEGQISAENTSLKKKKQKIGNWHRISPVVQHTAAEILPFFFFFGGNSSVSRGLHDVISDLPSHQVSHFPLGKRGNSSHLKRRCLTPGDECLVLFVLIRSGITYLQVIDIYQTLFLLKCISPSCCLGLGVRITLQECVLYESL